MTLATALTLSCIVTALMLFGVGTWMAFLSFDY